MNYRQMRKEAGLGLVVLALFLKVNEAQLHSYEQGQEPWPEGLLQRYQHFIENYVLTYNL